MENNQLQNNEMYVKGGHFGEVNYPNGRSGEITQVHKKKDGITTITVSPASKPQIEYKESYTVKHTIPEIDDYLRYHPMNADQESVEDADFDVVDSRLHK